MSQQERNGGRRELTYSHWHRRESIGRYLTGYQAQFLYMADVDSVERCNFCHQPVALIETTRYLGGDFTKDARTTQTLASRAGTPAYTVYFIADEPRTCPTCRFWVPEWPDIHGFFVDGPLPTREPPRYLDPLQYAEWLVELRLAHADSCPSTPGWRRRNWVNWRTA